MKTLKTVRLAFLLSLLFSIVSTQVQAACSIGSSGHATNASQLLALLPGDTRGVLAVEVDTLLGGSSSADVAAMMNGTGTGDPALKEPLSAIGALSSNVDVTMYTAVLAQTSDTADGLFLLAKVDCDTIDEATDLTWGSDTSHGYNVYLDGNGNSLSVLPGGLLIAGKVAAVDSVLLGGSSSLITPYLNEGALDTSLPFSFVYGLPAMIEDPSIEEDLSLMGAQVVSGTVDFFDGANVSVNASFHTANAAQFVEDYNVLDAESDDEPLVENASLGGSLPSSVGVTIPSTPIVKTATQLTLSRNVLKKLVPLMIAFDYADDIYDDPEGNIVSNKPWLNLNVSSEADTEVIKDRVPGSMFIRWEFTPAGLAQFEANELPSGFTVAAMSFLEEDVTNPNIASIIDAEGLITSTGVGKFLTLNLYNSAGSFVGGARAEFDIFVKPHIGYADMSPRFMVIEALSQTLSADPVYGMTPAEPMYVNFRNGTVPKNKIIEASVSKSNEQGEDDLLFEATLLKPTAGDVFPGSPHPGGINTARFTRAMAAGNDHIYWPHGISDHGLYNATTFNYDAYFMDLSDLNDNDENTVSSLLDQTHWKQYLSPDITYIVYYVNTLEYTVSLWENMGAGLLTEGGLLDMDNPTPQSGGVDVSGAQWLSELYNFRNNGNFKTLMHTGVKTSFKGRDVESHSAFTIQNTTPSVFYNFLITDENAIQSLLPAGYTLAPTHFYQDYPAEAKFLTLAIYEIEGSSEGTRAEWSVYVTESGGNGRERRMIIDLQTAAAAVDPISLINLPSVVDHGLSSGTVTTSLSSSSISFNASFDLAGSTEEESSLDWIEAGDFVCYTNGVCDKFYYGEGTLVEKVSIPAAVSFGTISTPWSGAIEATPSVVFYRDALQYYTVVPWYDLKVYVADPPEPAQPCCGTHTITGTGEMIGRTKSLINTLYIFYGAGTLDEENNEMNFYVKQVMKNVLGLAFMYTEGKFNLSTGVGTSTVTACTGPDLICAGVLPILGTTAATSLYEAKNLNASNMNDISWDLDFPVFVDTYGTADSTSSLRAQIGETEEVLPRVWPDPGSDNVPGGCAYNPRSSIDMLLMMLLVCGIFYGRNIRINRVGSC